MLIESILIGLMYVWVDEEGIKHISTVPRECIKGETGRRYIDVNCSLNIRSPSTYKVETSQTDKVKTDPRLEKLNNKIKEEQKKLEMHN
jgi:translation initiation factor 2 alpha subunit (eIF-2alpha)